MVVIVNMECMSSDIYFIYVFSLPLPSQEAVQFWNIIDQGTIADRRLLLTILHLLTQLYGIIYSFALSFLQRGFLCLAPLTVYSDKVIYRLPGTKQ